MKKLFLLVALAVILTVSVASLAVAFEERSSGVITAVSSSRHTPQVRKSSPVKKKVAKKRTHWYGTVNGTPVVIGPGGHLTQNYNYGNTTNNYGSTASGGSTPTSAPAGPLKPNPPVTPTPTPVAVPTPVPATPATATTSATVPTTATEGTSGSRPLLTNTANADAFGVKIPGAQIAVRGKGVCVSIAKGIMSGAPGSPWLWAQPGETLPIDKPIGSLLRFIIAVTNTDQSDLPTDGIFIRDDLGAEKSYRPVAGSLYVGGDKIRDLTADELTELVSGVKIPVSRYVDSIPAGATLGIVYDVRKGGNTVPQTATTTTGGSGGGTVSTANNPSAMSGSPSSSKGSSAKSWLWVILLIILIVLWRSRGAIRRIFSRHTAPPVPPVPPTP